MRVRALWLIIATISFCTHAGAQQHSPAPYPSPPAYYPPPYPYPPAAYPPPGYHRPPPPDELPYREGAPIPAGYHREERLRTGLVTAGWIVTAIPYGIGLIAAAGSDFRNQSGWLAVPYAGPWLTIGRRDYSCDDSDDEDAGLKCFGDVFLVMGLVFDGLVQAAGGTMLLIGYTSPKTLLVRDDAKLHLRPMRIGSGHGLGIDGSF
jgi:hypothetical protein